MGLHQTCSQPYPWTSWRTQQMYSKIRALPGCCDALALASTLGKDQHHELWSARGWDKPHGTVALLSSQHDSTYLEVHKWSGQKFLVCGPILISEVEWVLFKGHFRWFKTSCLDFLFFFKSIWHIVTYKMTFGKYRRIWNCGVPSSPSVVSRRCSICRDPSSNFSRLAGFHAVLSLTFWVWLVALNSILSWTREEWGKVNECLGRLD